MSEINFLQDYCDVIEFAADIKKTPRTVDRWCTQPNGLPFAWFGHKRLIHIPSAREWLLARVRKPNPRREETRQRRERAAEAAQST